MRQIYFVHCLLTLCNDERERKQGFDVFCSFKCLHTLGDAKKEDYGAILAIEQAQRLGCKCVWLECHSLLCRAFFSNLLVC